LKFIERAFVGTLDEEDLKDFKAPQYIEQPGPVHIEPQNHVKPHDHIEPHEGEL
jgi:hypothetical protein